MCSENHCEHEHHEHNHHHDHSKNEEITKEFCGYNNNKDENYWDRTHKTQALQEFTKIIHQLDSPVDYYEHSKEFRDRCGEIEIQLRWGVKASRHYKHAYVIGPAYEHTSYTILSDHDLASYDESVFPWANYDIIED